MEIQNAIMQRRTIRRFQNKPVGEDVVRRLVDLSRFYASGANLQPVRYIGITSQPLLDQVFANLRWAGYLPGFEILPDQRPMAYVVLTCNGKTKKNHQFDIGAAATTLMLAAEGEGLGSCCLGSFSTETMTHLLKIEDPMEPVLVIALGYPAQKSRAVDLTDNVKYYEDDAGCLCVPKRTLDEVLQML